MRQSFLDGVCSVIDMIFDMLGVITHALCFENLNFLIASQKPIDAHFKWTTNEVNRISTTSYEEIEKDIETLQFFVRE